MKKSRYRWPWLPRLFYRENAEESGRRNTGFHLATLLGSSRGSLGQ